MNQRRLTLVSALMFMVAGLIWIVTSLTGDGDLSFAPGAAFIAVGAAFLALSRKKGA